MKEKYVYYCPKCGKITMGEPGREDVPCGTIGCSSFAFSLGVTEKEYERMTEDEKAALHQSAMDHAANQVAPSAKQSSIPMETYIKSIHENVAAIRGWVSFWSILTIVGIVAWIIIYMIAGRL